MEITKEYVLKLSAEELEKLYSSLGEEDPLRREILKVLNEKETAEEVLLEDNIV